MSHDDKTEAQSRLAERCHDAGVFVGHVYTHWDVGGEYVVYSVMLDEATLEPRVAYYSLTYRTRWSRTLDVFTSLIEGVGVGPGNQTTRFRRVRPATLDEFLTAIDVRVTVAPWAVSPHGTVDMP
jgi:hypothetical protein